MQRQIESFPSVWKTNKYSTYFRYFREYVKWSDFNSLKASLIHTLFHKTTNKSWESQSELGRFKIRPGTSDFQYVNYAYEFALRNYLKNSIPGLTHFVDVGACIGEYVIWLTQLGVKCYAFEPVNYPILEENVKLNGLTDKIQVYRCGLGSKKEKVHFDIEPINTGASHINRNIPDGEANVEIDTMDAVFEDLVIADTDKLIIKLDVEDMEEEVIVGAWNFLSRVKNLEIIYEKLDENSLKIENALNQCGTFEFKRLDSHNMIAVKWH
jgi:FkbM family methyltransferase